MCSFDLFCIILRLICHKRFFGGGDWQGIHAGRAEEGFARPLPPRGFEGVRVFGEEVFLGFTKMFSVRRGVHAIKHNLEIFRRIRVFAVSVSFEAYSA